MAKSPIEATYCEPFINTALIIVMVLLLSGNINHAFSLSVMHRPCRFYPYQRACLNLLKYFVYF